MPNTMMTSLQVTRSWHEGGLFIGMHWLWWVFWVLTVALVAWAFIRLGRDRSETHRRVVAEGAAEEVLRKRFAEGEIGEEELARGLKVLHETGLGT